MIKKRRIKAIIFDFDLTLVNSFQALHAAWHDFKKYHQIDFLKIPEKQLWGISKDVIFKRIARLHHNRLSWQEIRDLGIKYTAKHFANLKFRELKMLEDFKKKKIKLGIISYNYLNTILKTAKSVQNRKIKFDFIISSESKKGKTKEQFLKYILKRSKIKKEELIYVGDHPQDIEEGKRAGVMTAGVSTGLFSSDQLKKYKPDILISKLSQLKKYVE